MSRKFKWDAWDIDGDDRKRFADWLNEEAKE